MNIIVVGCGRTGSRLAMSLCHLGHDVAVIDRDRDAFAQLDDDFDGISVAGVPVDKDVLRSAGIENCDALVTVTQNDSLNIMVSQIAIEFFNVPQVIARVADPARENVYSGFGLKTVCPTRLTAAALEKMLTKQKPNVVTLGSDAVNITVIGADKNTIGKSVKEVTVKKGEILFGVINSAGKTTLYPICKEYVITPKDQIVFARVAELF